MAHSWGMRIGLDLARRRPEWLYAYIGVGRMIDARAAERENYAWALGEGRRRVEVRAIKQLEAIAPYPGLNGELAPEKIDVERKWSVRFGGLTFGRSSYDVWENAERLSPDYTPADFAAIDAGSAFSFPKLLPDLAATDFTGVTRIGFPVLIFAGRYDHTTPNAPVRRWYERLQAPSKRWVWFENSAHMMYEEEPGRVLLHLVEDARPLAARAGDAAPDGPAG